jgi:hypothetical protein
MIICNDCCSTGEVQKPDFFKKVGFLGGAKIYRSAKVFRAAGGVQKPDFFEKSGFLPQLVCLCLC